jgi:hypothetical protein
MGAITVHEFLGIDLQVESYPAPLCDRCQVPQWLNKRVCYAGPPHTQLRLGFVCLTCGSETKLQNQVPIPLATVTHRHHESWWAS